MVRDGRWVIFSLGTGRLNDVFPFTVPLHVYPVYSRFYQDLLTIPYLVGSRSLSTNGTLQHQSIFSSDSHIQQAIGLPVLRSHLPDD